MYHESITSIGYLYREKLVERFSVVKNKITYFEVKSSSDGASHSEGQLHTKTACSADYQIVLLTGLATMGLGDMSSWHKGPPIRKYNYLYIGSMIGVLVKNNLNSHLHTEPLSVLHEFLHESVQMGKP